ncbi:hypothetical protein SAMN05216553_120104 [Lentzea fradiae]|uniref:Uncharacterized protein n=1 Tax=Lentzea fradiae TaxID=200378 RepID=A0A1G8BXG5_9PSEU|nr:hypothetical protein [Lentzea fradiae]SDH37804.1 hypothetical protein SAMN05216553_120104 [Lentzea fradiae]
MSMEAEFGEFLVELVAEAAPRLFAVCELERGGEGELTGAELVAWGLAFADQVQWVSTDGSGHGRFGSVDRAMRHFGRGCEASLVWA